MGRGKHMTGQEKAIARRMNKKGDSVHEVMVVLKRYETAVHKALKSVLSKKSERLAVVLPNLPKVRSIVSSGRLQKGINMPLILVL